MPKSQSKTTTVRSKKTKPKSSPREWPEWLERLLSRYKSGSAAKQEWADHAGEFLLRALDFSDELLSSASANATGDFDAVLRVMRSNEALRLLTSDPLADAFLRGIQARNRLIKENGGLWTTAQVAEFLGVSMQAVNKRRVMRQLLGLTFRKRGFLYPAWQFEQSQGTISGLEEVLRVLRNHDDWMQNVFFVSPNSRLRNRRPLDLLIEGKVAAVIDAARCLGEHGAA